VHDKLELLDRGTVISHQIVAYSSPCSSLLRRRHVYTACYSLACVKFTCDSHSCVRWQSFKQRRGCGTSKDLCGGLQWSYAETCTYAMLRKVEARRRMYVRAVLLISPYWHPVNESACRGHDLTANLPIRMSHAGGGPVNESACRGHGLTANLPIRMSHAGGGPVNESACRGHDLTANLPIRMSHAGGGPEQSLARCDLDRNRTFSIAMLWVYAYRCRP